MKAEGEKASRAVPEGEDGDEGKRAASMLRVHISSCGWAVATLGRGLVVGVVGLKREERADMKRDAAVVVAVVLLGVATFEPAVLCPVRVCWGWVGVMFGVVASFDVPGPGLLRVSGSWDRPSASAAPALPLNQLANPPPPPPLLLPSPV